MAPESFLGRGWSFPPTFSRGGRSIEMLEAEQDIRSSLKILLTTTVGERVMQPRYGCNLERLVFEPVDTTLQAYMKERIRTAILYFEPRIIVEDVVLIPDNLEGRIVIDVSYRIPATNTRANFVFPFYRDEGTEANT